MGDINEGESCANLKEEMSRLVCSFCQHLRDTWTDIGFDQDAQQRRGKAIYNFLRSQMRDILLSETETFKKIGESVDSSKRQIRQLHEELAIPLPQLEALPLLQLEQLLRQRINDLKKEKEHQIQMFNKLKTVERELCEELSINPYLLVESTSIPEKMYHLNQHIASLQKEKDTRQMNLIVLRNDVEAMLRNTEISPPPGFSQEATPTTDQVRRMTQLKEQLDARQNELRNQGDGLREKLRNLWDSLNMDPDRREHFLRSHLENKPSTIKSLRREVDRCEMLQQERVLELIMNARRELQELWERCHASQEQRIRVDAYSTERSGTDLLAAYQNEIRVWTAYSIKWNPLLRDIENLQNTWQRIKNFLVQSKDPKRFANRGGFLLQEERSRKRLNRDLKEAEDAVQAHALRYEQQGEWPLVVEGRSLSQLVAHYRSVHEQERPVKTRKPSVR